MLCAGSEALAKLREKGREPKATFPDTQRARRRNLHTTLSCMLVYQQLTTQTLEGAGPCHKTWCIVHIAQFSVHSSTRGEHCSQSLPRRGAPEWPKLRALQARRRAESVQLSETRPLNRASLPLFRDLVKFLSNSPSSEKTENGAFGDAFTFQSTDRLSFGTST